MTSYCSSGQLAAHAGCGFSSTRCLTKPEPRRRRASRGLSRDDRQLPKHGTIGAPAWAEGRQHRLATGNPPPVLSNPIMLFAILRGIIGGIANLNLTRKAQVRPRAAVVFSFAHKAPALSVICRSMEVRYDLPDFRRRMLAAKRRSGNQIFAHRQSTDNDGLETNLSDEARCDFNSVRVVAGDRSPDE